MNHRTFFLMACLLLPVHDQGTPVMKSLADTERAFAAMSVERGIRESFLNFFADDGISFQPGPVIYKEAVKGRPAPPNPHALTLDWKPIYGDVSEEGDLGYTTGPYVLNDNSSEHRPPRYGFYFSVWKRQPDSSWKVAMDIGIQTPEPYRGEDEFVQAPAVKIVKNVLRDRKAAKQDLMDAQILFSQTANQSGLATAYHKHGAPYLRLHRNSSRPLVGLEQVKQYYAKKAYVQADSVYFTDVAASGDLGYSYGRYEVRNRVQIIEAGYFGRVWKLDDGNAWKLAADVTNPLPKPSSP